MNVHTNRYTHMPKKRIAEREMFARRLGLDFWDREVQLLMKQCIQHHRLCENECNGCTREKYPSETWQEYDKARESQQAWIEERKDRVEATIAKKCAKLGLFAHFEGDPRGCTVKLQKWAFSKDQWGHNDCKDAIGANVWAW